MSDSQLYYAGEPVLFCDRPVRHSATNSRINATREEPPQIIVLIETKTATLEQAELGTWRRRRAFPHFAVTNAGEIVQYQDPRYHKTRLIPGPSVSRDIAIVVALVNQYHNSTSTPPDSPRIRYNAISMPWYTPTKEEQQGGVQTAYILPTDAQLESTAELIACLQILMMDEGIHALRLIAFSRLTRIKADMSGDFPVLSIEKQRLVIKALAAKTKGSELLY